MERARRHDNDVAGLSIDESHISVLAIITILAQFIAHVNRSSIKYITTILSRVVLLVWAEDCPKFVLAHHVGQGTIPTGIMVCVLDLNDKFFQH